MKNINRVRYLSIKEALLITFFLGFILKRSLLILFSAIFNTMLNENSYYTYIILRSCTGLFAWGIVLYYTNKYIKERKCYDRKNSYKIGLQGLMAGLLVVILSRVSDNLIMSLAYSYRTGEWQYLWEWGYMESYQPREYILQIISSCVIAPIAEEYYYRGIILKGLMYRYSPYKSLMLSAVLFALMHMVSGSFLLVIISGILFGYLYIRYQSLGLCILVHACVNIVSVIDPSYRESVIGIVVVALTYIIVIIRRRMVGIF